MPKKSCPIFLVYSLYTNNRDIYYAKYYGKEGGGNEIKSLNCIFLGYNLKNNFELGKKMKERK